MVYTPMMYGGATPMSEQEREARKARSLLKTEGNGWDVGSAVRFLASDLSRWMTGKQANSPSIPKKFSHLHTDAAHITGVILPVDAGTTAASGIGIKSLHDSTTGGRQP